MKLVTCPNVPDFSGKVPSLIFMAGGITGAPQWQEEFYNLVRYDISDDYVLINPRRPNFDVRDPSMSEEQIKWEFQFLERSSLVSFWFPKEAACMITLYELGKELGNTSRKNNVIIGAEVDYIRRIDLDYQVSNVLPGLKIANSLSELAEQLVERCNVDN